ncbi:MAG: hypothetical protein JNG88_09725 [Phycisphaerales bacterium]|nr:hypothetical protein [Phycisphaerales bacterium]
MHENDRSCRCDRQLVAAAVAAVLLWPLAGCAMLREIGARVDRTVSVVGEAGQEVTSVARTLQEEYRRNEPRVQQMADDIEVLSERARDLANTLHRMAEDAAPMMKGLAGSIESICSNWPKEKIDKGLEAVDSLNSKTLMENASKQLLEGQSLPALADHLNSCVSEHVYELKRAISNEGSILVDQALDRAGKVLDPQLDKVLVTAETLSGHLSNCALEIRDQAESLKSYLKFDLWVRYAVLLTAFVFVLAQAKAAMDFVNQCAEYIGNAVWWRKRAPQGGTPE